MPVSDVLRGFIGESAKFADDERHAQRQREDEEIGNQQALIRAYMEHPNVNPAMLGRMMEDYMSLGKAKSGPRKGKGGGAGFLGGTETPVSSIIQGLHSGEFMPSGDPDQPAGMTHGQPQQGQGGAGQPLGPASGVVTGGAPASPAAGGGVPTPPASGDSLMQAASGVPAPPKAQPLLLNTEAMSRREELTKSAGAYGTESGKLRARMDQAQQMVASGVMSPIESKLWVKKQMGYPLEHYDLKPVVNSADPTGPTRWVNHGNLSGDLLDPETHQAVTGVMPDPRYRAVASYAPDGSLTFTYMPQQPGMLNATGGQPPQVNAGAVGRVQFQPITPAVTTGPGGQQTTTLVPHAPMTQGPRPAVPPAPAAPPMPARPRTAADVPPPPAAAAGPQVSRANGMTSITTTHWDVDQKQIVDSVQQAAPMLARVEQALNKAYGADAKQYPDDFSTQMHEIGQGLRYAAGHAPSDATYQTLIPLVSFLKTFLTQPYLRGIRNLTYIEQIQNHMPHIQPPFPDSPRLVAEKIGIIKENLGGIMQELNAPNPFGGPLATSVPPPPRSGGMIRARDPKTNTVHEAPAGTPLPAGWILEP